ncbi:hypothetical protein V8G54_028502 [Vigna mungo]|uniref:Gnk2-homologous domain-containing protein n=1 Tax=Vigna mungo TaxID=3915 RepID=A0AAQ3MSP7_VIGMU
MFRRNMFLSTSTNHVTFLLFLSLFVIEPFCSSAAPVYNYCPTNASYNSTATFENNLKFLLQSLVSNVSESDGSYSTFMGLGSANVASGSLLCRGDVSLATCNDCITTAATEITQLCPNKTESIIWYDECMIRFTNTYFNPVSIEPGASLSNDENISASDLVSFNSTLFGLLDDLVEETASSNSVRKFATGDREFPGSSPQRRVYALTECDPELTNINCEECLQNAVSTLPSCCEGKQGARALLAWCNQPRISPSSSSTVGSVVRERGRDDGGTIVVIIGTVYGGRGKHKTGFHQKAEEITITVSLLPNFFAR